MGYALYVRKSTEEDERQTQSIEDQVRLAREQCRQRGKEISVELSESRSAKEPGRPEFGRLLALIDAGAVDGVVAWHPDRLSRNETDGAALTVRLRKGALRELEFVNYHFHNSPEGIMMLQIALSQSQYFSSKLSGDVRRGMDSKVRKGWSPHRTLPGYVNDKWMAKGEKTISADPVRFPLMRRAFDLFLTGAYSGKQIVTIMNREWGYVSLKTPKGGDAPMTKTTLYRLLRSPFYAGFFVENGAVHPGGHPAMITPEEHQRVLRLLGRDSRVQPKAHEFAYTGSLRCGKCGLFITAQLTKNRQGHEYVYYRCTRCRGQIVSEAKLQAQIDAQIEGVALIPEFVAWAVEQIEGWKETDRAAGQAVYAQKAASLASLGLQLENLLTALTKGLVTEQEYGERKAALLEERNGLKMALERAEQAADRVREAIENEVVFLGNVKEWMRTGDAPLRRACLKALGSNLVLQGDKVLLELHPLLVRVREENKRLEAEFRAIKPAGSGSGSAKKDALASVRAGWSCIWSHNQTLCFDTETSFPDLRPLAGRVAAGSDRTPCRTAAGGLTTAA